MMRIAIVSKSDASGGGAGRVAQDQAEWLRRAGHEVVHFARWGRPFDEQFRSAYGRLVRLAKRIERQVAMNETFPLELPSLLSKLRRARYDVVHFHDLSMAFTAQTVEAVSRRFPTVWTLHDQSPFTGGCLYATSCTKVYSHCGPCPKMHSVCLQGRRDMTGRIQETKRRVLRNFVGELVAPSPWVGLEGASAGFFDSPDRVTVIPNAIDLQLFQPVEQREARRVLGLPADRFVVLVVSHDLADVDKNPPLQREALLRANPLRPLVLLMGHAGVRAEKSYSGLDVRSLGYVADQARKNLVYAAADVFLNCSQADTFSLTTLESIASGTPVVAFRTGGIPSILVDDRAGLLVEPGDVDGLVSGLRRAQAGGDAAAWRSGARRRAEAFGHEQCVRALERVYTLAARGASAGGPARRITSG